MTAELEYGERLEGVDLLDYFGACLESSRQAFADWREEISGLYQMYGGRTLSEEDRRYLRERDKPSIEFNFAVGTLNAVLGHDMANKVEVVFHGADLGTEDQFVAEQHTALSRHAMRRSRGLSQEWDALLDVLITGYGWTEGYLDVNRFPVRPRLRHVPAWEIYPDPLAVENGLRDARFLIRLRAWTPEEVAARWPKHRERLRENVEQGAVPDGFPQSSREGEWRSTYGHETQGRVPVYEFQWVQHEPYVRFFDAATGEWGDLPAEEYKERRRADENLEAPEGEEEAPFYPYAKRCYYRTFIAGADHRILLEEPRRLSVPSFTYNVVTGYRDIDPGREENPVRFFGPARVIRDAQHYINTSMRLILELIATSAKGGGFIERSALTNSPEQFAKEYAKTGSMMVVEDGAVSQKKILLKQPTPIPPSVQELLRLCTEAITTLTGVTDWVKGTATQERSNVLISNLQQQSLTLLQPLFEPMSDLRVANAVLLVRLMLKHLSVEELDRVLGNDPVEGVTHVRSEDPETGELTWEPIADEAGVPITRGSLAKQVDPDEYDVVADIGQASPTTKIMVWQLMIQTNLIGTLMEAYGPELLQPFLAKLVKFLPVPVEMAKPLADALEGQGMGAQATPEQILESLAAMHPAEAMEVIQAAAAAIQGGAPPPNPDPAAMAA